MFVYHLCGQALGEVLSKRGEKKKNHHPLQGAYNQQIHKQDFDNMKPFEEFNLNSRKWIIH